MKKEAIIVKDGKQLIEDIEKISEQVKGGDVYLDDEIADYVMKIGEVVLNNYYLINGYKIFLGPADVGFKRLLSVMKKTGYENDIVYMYPHPEAPTKLTRITVG